MAAYDAAREEESDKTFVWDKDNRAVGAKTVRIDMDRGFGQIKPVLALQSDGTPAPDMVECTAVFNLDFKMNLPKSVINWITRTFAYYACKQVRNVCENLAKSEVHQKRMEEKYEYRVWSARYQAWRERKLAELREERAAKLDVDKGGGGVGAESVSTSK